MSTGGDVTLSEGTEAAQEAEDVELPPPVVTRTRSGRAVRAPSALLDSQAAKTPARRTRKSTLQELPGENTVVETGLNPDPDVVVVPAVTCVAECTGTEPAAPRVESQETQVCVQSADGDLALHHSHPAVMETAPERPDKKTAKKRTHSESSGKQTTAIPLGKPKSGRIWKDRNKQRFSALLRDKPLRSSWEKKMEAKREKELVKRYSLQLKEDKAKAKEDKRKRREENLKRRTENERKAEVVQVIRNTTKIKRMKKKQLRKIEKRDTLALLQKTTPQNTKATGKGSKPQNMKGGKKGNQ